jgi:hypothetical protein
MAVNSFTPRHDDIYVVSYPKSGTTLAQMMLYQLTSDGRMDFPHISVVSPWFEVAVRSGSFEHLERLPSPRVLKSHLLAKQMSNLEGRFIYLARNVYDIALSSYYHRCLVSGLEYELGAYLDEFIAGEVTMFGSWFEHIASWWPRRNENNVLFLLYEEVISDPEATVRRVARFCKLEVDEETIVRTVERSSFSFMKRYEHLFDPRMHRTSRAPEPDLLAALSPGVGTETLKPYQREMLAQKLGEIAEALDWSSETPRSTS